MIKTNEKELVARRNDKRFERRWFECGAAGNANQEKSRLSRRIEGGELPNFSLADKDLKEAKKVSNQQPFAIRPVIGGVELLKEKIATQEKSNNRGSKNLPAVGEKMSGGGKRIQEYPVGKKMNYKELQKNKENQTHLYRDLV